MYVNILDIINRPSFFQNTTFQRLNLSPSSGEQKKGRGPTLVGPLQKHSLFNWTFTLCIRNAELLIVKAGGTYSYHWALKG
jgi:hypothetical protein